jgi:hypothetical protein
LDSVSNMTLFPLIYKVTSNPPFSDSFFISTIICPILPILFFFYQHNNLSTMFSIEWFTEEKKSFTNFVIWYLGDYQTSHVIRESEKKNSQKKFTCLPYVYLNELNFFLFQSSCLYATNWMLHHGKSNWQGEYLKKRFVHTLVIWHAYRNAYEIIGFNFWYSYVWLH